MQPPEIGALLPLTPAVFHILLALADGESHGYAIMQRVAQQTGSAVRLGPATLYRSLRSMLEAGLIEETNERVDPALDDERRRYYRLSGFGQRVAQAEIERLRSLLSLAQAKPLLQHPPTTPGGGG
jgi:DNA-binding PadR family transcriptional regulator